MRFPVPGASDPGLGQLPGHGQIRKPTVPQRVYLASILAGRAAVAPGYGSLPCFNTGTVAAFWPIGASMHRRNGSPPPLVVRLGQKRGHSCIPVLRL